MSNASAVELKPILPHVPAKDIAVLPPLGLTVLVTRSGQSQKSAAPQAAFFIQPVLSRLPELRAKFKPKTIIAGLYPCHHYSHILQDTLSTQTGYLQFV